MGVWGFVLFSGKEEGAGVFLLGLGTLALAEQLIYPLPSHRCLEVLVTSDKSCSEGLCVGWHRDRPEHPPGQGSLNSESPKFLLQLHF